MTKDSNIILDYLYTWIEWGNIWDRVSFSDQELRTLYDGFSNTGKCPYCSHITSEVLRIDKCLDEFHDEWLSLRVFGCRSCGWWCQQRSEIEPFGPCRQSRQIGILKEFEPGDVSLPLTTLEMELNKRPAVLYDVHNSKFEELVADVLGDFYHVEIAVVGKTNDGGIDLLYLDGDTPCAIQVKRRQKPNKVETVSLVREFLGAIKLKNFTRGAIVTTAERFSKGSYRTTDEAINQGLVEQFELVDMKRFLEIFRFHPLGSLQLPWQHIVNKRIQAWQDDPYATIKTGEELSRSASEY